MEQNISPKQATNIYTVGALAITLKALFNFSSIFSLPSIIDNALNVIFVLCMLYLILNQIISIKTFLLFLAFGLCCAFTYYKAHYYYLIVSFLTIWAVNNVDLKSFLKKKMVVVAIFLMIHISIYAMMSIFTPDAVSYIYRNGVKRHFFLMSHPNTFAMLVAWCLFEYVYIYYKKLDLFKIIILFVICFLTKTFTDSNTALIAAILIFSFLFCDKYHVTFVQKLVRFLSKYAFAFCTVFFSLMTVLYTKLSGIGLLLYNTLNDIFTGRMLYGAYVYDTNKWTLFGKTIHFDSKTYWRGYWFDEIMCDNTYIWCFVCYGLFYMIMISIAFIKIEKKTTSIEKIFIVAYIFYGVMEAYILNSMFCFPLLFIGKYIFEKKGEDQLETKD